MSSGEGSCDCVERDRHRNSVVLGNYTTEQPEANRTIEARGCLVRSLVRQDVAIVLNINVDAWYSLAGIIGLNDLPSINELAACGLRLAACFRQTCFSHHTSIETLVQYFIAPPDV